MVHQGLLSLLKFQSCLVYWQEWLEGKVFDNFPVHYDDVEPAARKQGLGMRL